VALSRRTGRLGRTRFTLLFLVLASITLLTLDFRDTGPVTAMRRGVASVFSPARGLADAVAEPVSNGWNGISGYDDLEKENERLQRRIDDLEGQRATAATDQEQLDQLRNQLDIKVAADIPTVVARVVSGPLTSFDDTIEIDRGSGEGVKEGMAVVTDAGLVGKVVRVTGGRSSIELITSPSFEFGVRLVEQQDVGIAKGQGDDGTLLVESGITTGTKVEAGDRVATSGIDGSTFPPDVAVGRVKSVRPTDDRTEQVLVIEPVANLGGLSYVTVLLCDTDCA
jgi:rod shape-determining protein MreC